MKNDQSYIEILANKVGTLPSNLTSVIGENKLKSLLSSSKPEYFSTGKILGKNLDEVFENILNCKFRINLHVHTQESDGDLSINELLDQAAKYAHKVSKNKNHNDNHPPYIIGITDHDSVESAQRAVSIIGSNPQKYKNLGIVAGIEFSGIYQDPELLSKPLALDILTYCINPFDESLISFITSYKEKRFKAAEQIIKQVNDLGININLESAKQFHSLVNQGASIAFFDLLKEYILVEIKKKNLLNYLHPTIDELFNKALIENTPEISEIVKAVNNSQYGFVGIAHPARIDLENYLNSINNANEYNKAIYLFIKRMKELGITASEYYYQYRPKYYIDNNNPKDRVKNIQKVCNELNLIQTGGTDCHRKNIFTHHDPISEEYLGKLLSN